MHKRSVLVMLALTFAGAQVLAPTVAQTNNKDANSALLNGNYAAAVPVLRMMAERGEKSSQRMLASMYEAGIGGIPKDYAEALRWYQLAANKFDAEAQSALGRFYMHGYGIARDYKKAKEYFELAAKEGSRTARLGLAILYIKGWGVRQSYEEGFKYCELAAKQGLPAAQYNLAELYRKGDGVTANLAEAQFWYKKSAYALLDGAIRDPNAYQVHCALGTMYGNGWGLAKNQSESQKWYARGLPVLKAKAKSFDPEALFYLAELSQNGWGIPKNNAAALNLYKQAAARGDMEAQSRLTGKPTNSLPPLKQCDDSGAGSVSKTVVETNSFSSGGLHHSETSSQTEQSQSNESSTKSSSSDSSAK